MKKIILFAIALTGFCPVFAQSQVTQTTGVSISHHEATIATSTPKMFAIPIVAETKLISSAPTSFTMKSVINIPAYSSSDTKSSYYASVSSLIKNKIEELKSQAIFDFTEQTGADVILSPMFSIKTENSVGLVVNVVIKVKGYPAKYENFRSLSANDYNLVVAAENVDGSNVRQTVSNVSKTDKLTTKEIHQ